jgi:MoxR-like ATPase
MDAARHRRAAEIFAEVVDLPEEERARRIAESCGSDEELRDEVKSLLRALPEAERYFGFSSDTE